MGDERKSPGHLGEGGVYHGCDDTLSPKIIIKFRIVLVSKYHRYDAQSAVKFPSEPIGWSLLSKSQHPRVGLWHPEKNLTSHIVE